ncbi:MAG: MBL fold metallo-hydrolase, partial [Blastomonas sp.]|nr:MBL fold metallo-hydrolase [Blastomonas sp.]
SETDRGSLTVMVRRGEALVAERSARLLAHAGDVAMEEVPAFAGARLYRPRGDRPLPLVIVLGGSEGGSATGRALAPRFAEMGYAALALPYYNPPWTGEDLPGLPQAFVDIPADRLAAVRDWAQGRGDIAADRIAVYGVSKGGEFAMLAAARHPWLRAIVGIVPSDVVWEGWGTRAAEGSTSSFAWQGEPLAFVPYLGMGEAIAALTRGENTSLTVPHLEGRRAHPDRAARARIPVERYAGAVLVAGGDPLALGETAIRVLHTPGHTPACLTYRIDDAAFVGDTLFMPDYGTARADFPGGDAATLYRSIRKILALPSETRIFVGHDYLPKGRSDFRWETTVAEQRAANVHVHDGVSEAEFVAMREARDATLDAPTLILPSLQVNIQGGKLPSPDAEGRAFLRLPINALGKHSPLPAELFE